MNLNSARIFINVVAQGSFSSAAKFMAIPVATVSRRVAELESSLDVRLLERSTRRLRLTEAGSILYKFVSRGVEEMDAGIMALTEQEQHLKGSLRLSIPSSFEPMWKLLDDFQQLHTNIEIDLFVSERRLDFIEDRIDVALRIGDVASQSAIARLLMIYRHRLVASPEFMAGLSIDSPQDILSKKCAAWCQKDQDIIWNLGKEKLAINPFFRTNEYMHIRYLTLNHKCITELPPFFCQKYIDSGELVEVLPDYPMPEQQVNLVYPSRKSVSRITRVFIDYIVKNFKVSII
ncbi:MAG: LysR substrate-binding domain-containing protein [Rhodobacteraceae bacterium]|nr:LysR substrate-binding domain-containing protein [Paracoccaceae bacterium]